MKSFHRVALPLALALSISMTAAPATFADDGGTKTGTGTSTSFPFPGYTPTDKKGLPTPKYHSRGSKYDMTNGKSEQDYRTPSQVTEQTKQDKEDGEHEMYPEGEGHQGEDTPYVDDGHSDPYDILE